MGNPCIIGPYAPLYTLWESRGAYWPLQHINTGFICMESNEMGNKKCQCKLQHKGMCQPDENCGCVPACMHGWVFMCVYALPTLSIFHHSAVCPVSSNLSCFTSQAAVEPLSLCGLSVVSGLLTQDLVKWVFFLSFLFQKLTYTQAQTSNKSPLVDMHACNIWDVKIFGSVVSPLVL